ncbi:MAG: ABC-F family ATP-binding cassette domain-containing protein [Clostridia bacterium]|nr:ABC-F family ATP-binding cassette domain-containing protein [Clostridia bacterium]
MSIIELKDFSKDYGEKALFVNTTFTLNEGEKVFLTGLNGAGKSTLLKVLIGEVLLDKGSLTISKKHSIKYLDQHASIDKTLTIKQYLCKAYKHLYDIEDKINEINAKLAIENNPSIIEKLMFKSGDLYEYLENNNFYEIDSNVEKVCAGLGVKALGLDTVISTLSGGQRAKVILSKLLLENPDVMILDEPTNFLDINHIEWLSKFIKNSDKSFIIVSHDETFINNVATHICDVADYKITKYTGNLRKANQIKAEQSEILKKSYENQQKEIKKLEDYIDRNRARASTAKMAHSRQVKLDKMERITIQADAVKPTFSFDSKPFVSHRVMYIDNLVVGYNNKPLLNPITFEVCNSDRIAIVGFNGIGKTTLLKTILGIINKISGNVEISNNVVIGYYEQENNFNSLTITPLTYISNKFPKLTEKECRASLYRCGLTSEHCKKSISKLSGGEQSKIKLCEITLKKCNVLILDEPTNHLDKLAIDRLIEAINEFVGTVIIVSHSKPFIDKVSTKIINLENKIKKL